MNLSKILAIAQLLYTLATSVIPAFVQAIENTANALPGSQKFAAVEAAVNGYVSKLENGAELAKSIAGEIGPLIEGAVQMFNASGLFQHKTVAPAPPAHA
jgi:hypothetical protein